MTNSHTAWDFLGCGDALRARVKRDRSTVAAVAADAGLPAAAAAKAYWLAGVYEDPIRRRISRAVLQQLSAMHLEVVANCDDLSKERLLCSAATRGLTARQLRKIARSESETVPAAAGTIAALRQSAHAMEQYSSFDDRSLRTLLSGPNGEQVRQAASAGWTLSVRLSAVGD
jgi:hypothetical protein